MPRSKDSIPRLPKRKKDWVGWWLEAASLVKTGTIMAPRGSLWEIVYAWAGKVELLGPECEHCGVRPVCVVRAMAGQEFIAGFETRGPEKPAAPTGA